MAKNNQKWPKTIQKWPKTIKNNAPPRPPAENRHPTEGGGLFLIVLGNFWIVLGHF